MILTQEELALIKKVLPILQKIASSDGLTNGEVVYGMGVWEDKIEGWSMLDGPTPVLMDLLKFTPLLWLCDAGPYYILQLNEGQGHIKLYKWDDIGLMWKKLKQAK
jgi:hypothetical protein